MKKLLVMNDAKTGCAWWRGIGPWSSLVKSGFLDDYGFDVEFGNDFDWAQIRAAHAVFLLRPSTPQELRVIKQAKWFGTKVWLDYDDDLFSVPPENPSSYVYSSPKTQSVVEECLRLADLVTFSTPFLMEKMKSYCPNASCSVVRNGYDSIIEYHRQPLPSGAVSPVVLWRGSNTHHKDLNDFEEQIVHLANSKPELLWLFIGVKPWFHDQIKNSHSVMDNLSITDYFETLASVHALVGIVPLTDNDFNRGKSNIAAMELGSTGASIVCPDWDEWKIPGVFQYGNCPHTTDTFSKAFEKALADAKGTRGGHLAMMGYFKDQCSVRELNKFRTGIIFEHCT